MNIPTKLLIKGDGEGRRRRKKDPEGGEIEGVGRTEKEGGREGGVRERERRKRSRYVSYVISFMFIHFSYFYSKNNNCYPL